MFVDQSDIFEKRPLHRLEFLDAKMINMLFGRTFDSPFLVTVVIDHIATEIFKNNILNGCAVFSSFSGIYRSMSLVVNVLATVRFAESFPSGLRQ